MPDLHQHLVSRTGLLHLGEVRHRLVMLIESPRHGEVDLALVHLPVTIPGVTTSGLARYRYSVAAAGDPDLPTGRPLRPSDLRGRKLLSFPLTMQPAPMKAMLDALTGAGVAALAEIDLRDVIGLEGRMARTGELMLATLSDDLPAARFLDLDRLRSYPVADDEIRFEIGLAWRARLRPPRGHRRGRRRTEPGRRRPAVARLTGRHRGSASPPSPGSGARRGTTAGPAGSALRGGDEAALEILGPDAAPASAPFEYGLRLSVMYVDGAAVPTTSSAA